METQNYKIKLLLIKMLNSCINLLEFSKNNIPSYLFIYLFLERVWTDLLVYMYNSYNFKSSNSIEFFIITILF